MDYSVEDPVMKHSDIAIGAGLILALAGGLSGCNDPAVGTIKADRRALEELQRAVSDRTTNSSPSKSSKKNPDYNDLSPKLPGGGVQR
jgi:hypothetical protein